MRAALYDRYGPPEVLYVGEVPKPVAGPGQVLVRVAASSVNGGELYGRAGRIRVVTGLRRFPLRTGLDFAGEVAAVGRDVADLAPGQHVWGLLGRRFGSAAEFVVVAADRLAPAPAGLDLTRAAALPAVATTVVTALRDKAGLRAGERLLVRGASGGVGHVAVQLGRAYGAHVTGLAGAGNLEFVRGLGAHEVADYRTTRAWELPRFDVVLDTVGTELPDYRRLLTRTGRMVTVSFDIDHVARSLAYLLMSTVHGRRRVRFFSGDPRSDLLAEVTRLTENGSLRPVVDRTFPLADIARAHRALEEGGVRGKIVVTVGNP
ncbi:NAD(P)-dependent alcohol dehydrogenase [Actinophytocola xanthii]|uniref:NAD(P)-dependent alcohol dehydrogenase n=2 Tax=Actinophytocola xanthii TaxID=1912961 RepID=A0A1Q8CE32_9PSEU|nr:NAD(P)-dependent alcohol dehydrogenase [Actinophytocola xanthii]OLF12631.1 NAD(P)-dependent alcohol dehydrogenase [Actinophytocola xanthii]